MELQAAPVIPEHDEFDLFWLKHLADNRYDAFVIDPTKDAISVVQTTGAPLGYGNLMALLGSRDIARLPGRSVYGHHVHAYCLATSDTDLAVRDAYDGAPLNTSATEVMRRNGCDVELRGPVVLVTRDGIDHRDSQAELIDADAETMPEIERDHLSFVGPNANVEWDRLSAAMNGQVIPSTLSTVPSMDRIAWLVRLILIDIDTDIISHAAMAELCHKKPLVAQAIAALWGIQASYFAGQFQEATQIVDGPPAVPAPAGFSARHQQVVH